MKKLILLSFFPFVIFFVAVRSAFAEITVFDDVTVIGTAIRLKAQTTKAFFFPDGGKLVKFHVDENHAGTTLSGGDGYAFLKYTPASKGLKKLQVESGSNTVEGLLLVAGKKERIVLLVIEKLMLESFAASKNDSGAADTLKKLSGKYLIIYLFRTAGTSQTRKWLAEKDFPVSVVLEWEGADMIEDLGKRGLNLHAVIGPPDLLSEAGDIKKRFSFEDTDNGEMVEGWDALYKLLTDK